MRKQLVLTLTLLLPTMALYGEPVQNHPRGSERTGTITALIPSRFGIVIGDKGFAMSPSTRILNVQGKPGYYADLVKGQPVHYFYTLDEARRYVLTRIQILPGDRDVSR